MNSKTRACALALLTGLIIFVLMPSVVRSDVSVPIPFQSSAPVYEQLDSRISTSPGNSFETVTVTFSIRHSSEATVFLMVGTIIPAFQCCPGAYLLQLSIDDGPITSICGGVTSQFTNVVNTISCFTRVGLAAGNHSLTMIVFNGGGTWMIESGSTTAVLIQFD